MSQDQSQHATRREWWIADGHEKEMNRSFFQAADRSTWANEVHVREVLPGEVTITREQFRNYWRDVWDDEDTFDAELNYLEERMFGPPPEGHERTETEKKP